MFKDLLFPDKDSSYPKYIIIKDDELLNFTDELCKRNNIVYMEYYDYEAIIEKPLQDFDIA